MKKIFKSSIFKGIVYPVMAAFIIVTGGYFIDSYKNDAVKEVKKHFTDSIQTANIQTINNKIIEVDSMFTVKNRNSQYRMDKQQDQIATFIDIAEKIEENTASINKKQKLIFNKVKELQPYKDVFYYENTTELNN